MFAFDLVFVLAFVFVGVFVLDFDRVVDFVFNLVFNFERLLRACGAAVEWLMRSLPNECGVTRGRRTGADERVDGTNATLPSEVVASMRSLGDFMRIARHTTHSSEKVTTKITKGREPLAPRTERVEIEFCSEQYCLFCGLCQHFAHR